MSDKSVIRFNHGGREYVLPESDVISEAGDHLVVRLPGSALVRLVFPDPSETDSMDIEVHPVVIVTAKAAEPERR